MLDNQPGSSVSDFVTSLQEQRKANQPDLDETTGGTEEVQQEVVESQPEEVAESIQQEAMESGSETLETEELDEAEAPQTFTVKVDGVESEVNFEERKAGYQRDQDYRKKTMLLADERKVVEQQNVAMAEKLTQLQAFIEQKEDSINWEELRDTDPGEYLKQREAQDERKEAFEREKLELDKKQQGKRQEMISQETAKLIDIMGPTWTDDKRAKDFEAAGEYLRSRGVTDEESGQFIDARLWAIIMDAKEYRRLQNTKTRISKEVKTAPKSVKPGQRRQTTSQDQVAQGINNLRNAKKGDDIDAFVALSKAKRGKKP